jgi:carbonic anhydrase
MTLKTDTHMDNADCCGVSRRAALVLTTVGASTAIAGVSLSSPAFAASLTREQRDALTPDDIIRLILEGNARFLSGNRQPRDFLEEQRASGADGQYPAAVFLTCVDSRAPVEILCDLGIGDAFNARVAGNVVNDDILGSMEFATAVAGAKVVMVMGHTKCGAVAGAIDGVRLGNLTLLLARLGNAIAETQYDGDRSGLNYGFVDAVAATQVKLTIDLIRDRSQVMRDLESEGKIRIVGAMYDIDSGQVALLS